MANLVDLEARLENDPDCQADSFQCVLEPLRAVRSFLLEAQKLASWIDTGEA